MIKLNYLRSLLSASQAQILRIATTGASLSGALLLSTQALSAGASVGAGLGITTEFTGSDELTVIPIAEFEIPTKIGILKNDQLGAQLDLVKNTSLDTGPIIRFNTGRNDSVTDDVVAALPEIEGSFEAGWFIGSGFKVSSLGLASDAIVIGRLSVVSDIGDGHGGTVVNGSLGLVMDVSEKLRLIPSVSFVHGNDEYTNAFYGVDAADASAELGSFNASGGLETAQIALVGIQQINPRWFVKGIAAYNTLQDDAAESSIARRGSDDQIFAGFTVNYRY